MVRHHTFRRGPAWPNDHRWWPACSRSLLLALAGIPLTSGFVGKFVVFSAAMNDGMGPLVVVALVASTVAASFYLRVIVLMYFSSPPRTARRSVCPAVFTNGGH